MTPDEARALLDGTTPAYEWWADIGGFDRIRRAGPIEWGATGDGLECTEADAWLIAAAPTLAATIAGMRTEYRTEEWQGGYPGWVPTSPWTAEKPAGGTDPNTRVVRRYVTEPEEA